MTVMHDGEGRRPRDTLRLRLIMMRSERRVSQREAAIRCGLSYGEWQSLEDGRDAKALDVKVQKIADGLDYEKEWIMWGGTLRNSPPDGGPALVAQGIEQPPPKWEVLTPLRLAA